MPDNLIIIDSDILIDVGRNDKIAIERIKEEEKKFTLAISAVTQMELIVGCRNKTELKHLDKFLDDFEIINLNFEISQKAIELLKEYRLSHGLLIADSIISSTSLILDVLYYPKIKKIINSYLDLKYWIIHKLNICKIEKANHYFNNNFLSVYLLPGRIIHQ